MSTREIEPPSQAWPAEREIRTMLVGGRLINVPGPHSWWWNRRTSGWYVFIEPITEPDIHVGLLFYEVETLAEAIRSVVRQKLLGCTRMFLITDHNGVHHAAPGD